VAEIVRFLFSLGGLAFLLLGGILWLRARPASSAPRRYLLVVATAYVLASTYAVDYLLGRLLVFGFHPFSQTDVPSGRIALVVLGSGSLTARDWNGGKFSELDRAGAMRVVEAVRVYRLANPEWVISSGGDPDLAGPLSSAGVMMRDEMVRLGVPGSRILVESESGNTHDEAILITRMLAARHIDHVILVTSELHMRRALGVFRAAGVEAVPAKARGVFTTLPWYVWVTPSSEGLQEGSLLAHEVFGIPYYLARGWIKLG
jgi:uncharacterized SAM-binding protein YcdF (DUF218 family)